MRRRKFVMLIGAAAAWPLAARAQQPGKIYRIAIVIPAGSVEFLNEAKSPRNWRPFFEELRRQGFVEGQNLVVERYSGEGETDRYAELARRVVASTPDVIITQTTRLALDFKAATTTIPIVASAAAPIASGLVPSLAHPGGNITGVAGDAGVEFYAKHLELVRQVIPSAVRVAYLTPRAVWESATLLTPVKDAAKEAGISLIPALLDAPIEEAEYRRVFAALAETRVDALIVGDSAEHYSQQRLIIDLAEHARLPAVYPGRIFVERGGLISYGAEGADLVRRRASDVARILNGAKPGDIPFYQATRFELVINLKTATALGLTISPTLLSRADEVIE
jgi:putative tryptophan/tyrosine transport system substrate-binding protein